LDAPIALSRARCDIVSLAASSSGAAHAEPASIRQAIKMRMG
jgi:hypothetical protein